MLLNRELWGLQPEVKMESKEQVTQQLLELVANGLKVRREAVSLDSGPLVLPEWDSFFHVHLMVAVEERYSVAFDPDAIATMISVRDILLALQEKGVVER